MMTINGFNIQEGRTGRFEVFLPEDDRLVSQHHSLTAAVQWCHQPALHQVPQDQFWFYTENEKSERLMFRAERAREIAKHVLEHVPGMDNGRE